MLKFWRKFLARIIPYHGSIYRRIGGKKVIDKLVDDFYSIMATDPAAKECFATHQGRDLKHAAVKLKAFLSGWLGGPPVYMNQFGHPRLRMRHFPFQVGQKESEQWLYCMEEALKNSHIDFETQKQLLASFKEVTMVIKNRE